MSRKREKKLPIWNDLPPVQDERPRPEPTTGLSRRGFLQALGVGVGGAAALAACERIPVDKAIPLLIPAEGIIPGTSLPYASTCTACSAACGLVMNVRDGRPIKLEGLATHPGSRGGLCAVGQADLRALYDVDRVQKPTLGGVACTWAALDAYVIEGLAAARAAGKPVALLSGTVNSPTGQQAIADLAQATGLRPVAYDPDPESASALLEAYEHLDGVARVPALRFDQADLIVSIASDFLGAGRNPVGDTSAYAQRRGEARKRGAMRHLQIEGALSLTGAAADERHLATFAERRAFALELLAELARLAGHPQLAALASGAASTSSLSTLLPDLVADLRDSEGRCLIVSGDDDLVTQAAVALANRLLGAEGKTLDLKRSMQTRRAQDRDLIALRADLEAGRLGGLIVLDLDPVEQIPGGEALAEAIGALPFSVAISSRPTATAKACGAIAAAHHGLESWGDHAPTPDLISLSQPGVRPLFGTRHTFENLLHWRGAPQTGWLEALQARWRKEELKGGDFDVRWHTAVSEGFVVRETASFGAARGTIRNPTEGLKAALAQAPAPMEVADLQVELVAEVGLREGARAFVPWLRELPDPLTRASWTACARVAPELGKKLGVENGDLLEVEVEGRKVTMPARILPGHHPGVIGIPVGYGRSDGGGDSTENAYRLMGQGARFSRRGLSAVVRRTGAQVVLPLMQWHSSTEDRPYLQTVESPTASTHRHAEGHSLWGTRERSGQKWGMVIDLDRCTGCSACVIACQAENNIPVVGADEIRRHRDMYWIRIDRYFSGDEDDPEVLFQPMLCGQCDNAPCETVCPVAATVHSVDGLNMQVYNRCVGTRYCANNCPYKVRRFNWFDHEMTDPVERMVLNPDVVYRERGVMEKCTYCVQRIQRARIDARADGHGAAFEVSTACQQSCPAQAIRFGDVADPKSEVTELTEDTRAFQALEEIAVAPSLTYLARIRKGQGSSEGGSHHE